MNKSILIALALAMATPTLAQDATTALLRRLSEASGPSGFEEPVRKIMVPELRAVTDDLRYDGLVALIQRLDATTVARLRDFTPD